MCRVQAGRSWQERTTNGVLDMVGRSIHTNRERRLGSAGICGVTEVCEVRRRAWTGTIVVLAVWIYSRVLNGVASGGYRQSSGVESEAQCSSWEVDTNRSVQEAGDTRQIWRAIQVHERSG